MTTEYTCKNCGKKYSVGYNKELCSEMCFTLWRGRYPAGKPVKPGKKRKAKLYEPKKDHRGDLPRTMSLSRHRKSGKPGKPPSLRQWLCREANNSNK